MEPKIKKPKKREKKRRKRMEEQDGDYSAGREGSNFANERLSEKKKRKMKRKEGGCVQRKDISY